MLPSMDKDVMMKIIDQFPEFRLFAKDVLDNIEQSHTATLGSNSENQKDLYESFVDIGIIIIIEDQLNKDNVTFEEKNFISIRFLKATIKSCLRIVKTRVSCLWFLIKD
jgi:hypothetical protein